jgi:hypothetical protein
MGLNQLAKRLRALFSTNDIQIHLAAINIFTSCIALLQVANYKPHDNSFLKPNHLLLSGILIIL